MRYKCWLQSSLSPTSSEEPWVQSLVTFNSNQWLLVVYDVDQLSTKIQSTYTSHVTGKLSHLPSDVLSAIKGNSSYL
jgi:hypothetical protein